MRYLRLLRTGAVLLACAALVTLTTPARGAGEDPSVSPGTETGQRLYASLCASCHGVSGMGDGPMLPELRVAPADLTRISARHGGEFPTTLIQEIIDGRRRVRGHGPGNMPVWGRHFERTETAPDAPSEIIVRGQVQALTEYLKTIQRPAE